MCVIITKRFNEPFPSYANVARCVAANPDGFAMTIVTNDGLTHTYKTMSSEKFLMMYQFVTNQFNPTYVALLIHCRWATNGSKNESNCHNWSAEDFAFAHNGVLPIQSKDDMTDSETYLRYHFLPLYHKSKRLAFQDAKRVCESGQRFAFLMNNGTFRLFGKYERYDGNSYSNLRWLSVK